MDLQTFFYTNQLVENFNLSLVFPEILDPRLGVGAALQLLLPVAQIQQPVIVPCLKVLHQFRYAHEVSTIVTLEELTVWSILLELL